jgi:hypothetical protein
MGSAAAAPWRHPPAKQVAPSKIQSTKREYTCDLAITESHVQFKISTITTGPRFPAPHPGLLSMDGIAWLAAPQVVAPARVEEKFFPLHHTNPRAPTFCS